MSNKNCFRSIIWDMPSEEFRLLVQSSETLAQILKAFGLLNKGGNTNTVKRRIIHENIDMSHITLGRGSNKGKEFARRRTNEEMFVENSTINRSRVKQRIRKDNLIVYECRDCGMTDTWNDKPITLQLEHCNGVCNDNRIENLCFLCPNCHSQTPTYAGKRFKKPKPPKNPHWRNLPKPHTRKVERPTKDELDNLIQQYPMTTIGKMYGVSDNAVRKWVRSYEKFGSLGTIQG